ncbi:MAG: hypothetical protein KA099_12725 [Alphaproteobacteria bacterium]|nr:hypothetical protein [Alphaproteobacteria bacterium]MBP7760063.1 hypothetical protein [Alphaproteobacteria bacterium]MBP7763425.1 hypothetical protein [Alphaproteobacteria bacterium]MBP7906175.1 hypothetical protein [Alphaproteobacteria bacterium]
MTKKTVPARVHAIIARQKPIAIVFRRGPSKKVCSYLWDLKKDKFKLGQWLKGRIYERRADISPDGKHIIYFAANNKLRTETRGAWTALSRTPWLKAIELYAWGDCWQGGGLFLDNSSYWLNDFGYHENGLLKKSSAVRRDKSYRPPTYNGYECTGVYYNRLLRDGWKYEEKQGQDYNSWTIFSKKLQKGWVLRKIAHEQIGAPIGRGCYWDEHELINQELEVNIKHKNWEWAEFYNNKLYWACDGQIFKASISSGSKIGTPKMLYDFNSETYEEITAPY